MTKIEISPRKNWKMQFCYDAVFPDGKIFCVTKSKAALLAKSYASAASVPDRVSMMARTRDSVATMKAAITAK